MRSDTSRSHPAAIELLIYLGIEFRAASDWEVRKPSTCLLGYWALGARSNRRRSCGLEFNGHWVFGELMGAKQAIRTFSSHQPIADKLTCFFVLLIELAVTLLVFFA